MTKYNNLTFFFFFGDWRLLLFGGDAEATNRACMIKVRNVSPQHSNKRNEKRDNYGE